MLTHIRLQNYRSFVDAEVDLAPFTLVLGANGAGKTNFLKAFVDSGHSFAPPYLPGPTRWLEVHTNCLGLQPKITFTTGEDALIDCIEEVDPNSRKPERGSVELFCLSPDRISAPETIMEDSFVSPDGSGTTQCLEALKNGDQESLFREAERALMTYVPEIEKLSFVTVGAGIRQIQVRETGIAAPVPATQLSEGTRLIIALLAIIFQPVKPPVICLEDIDRGMHPRIFEQMADLMRRIAREQDVQIIATTHNPYLVDCFQDEPNAVVIVEKKDGASTLTTLAAKLEGLDYDKIDPTEMPLGNLWFSGFVGGVPDFLQARQRR